MPQQQQTEDEILKQYGLTLETEEDKALAKYGLSAGDQEAAAKLRQVSAGPKAVSIPLYNAQGQITPVDKPLTSGEQTAMAPLGWLAGGEQQLGQGMYGLSHPESPRQMAGAASDVIRGGFTVATPFLLPSMLANIPATALGLGTFTGAQAGIEWAGEKAGIPDEYNRLLGDLVGMYGGAKVHGWINKFGEIPDQRVANAIFQRTLAAAESLKDPKLSSTERAATKAGLDAMMGSLKESEQWGMPKFFEGVKGTGAGAGADHVPGPAGPPIRLTGKALWHYQYLVNLQRKSPQEALRIALTGAYTNAMPGEKRFGVKNLLTPEAQANEAWFREQGIQTPLGMQTENKAAQNLGAIVQNLPGGGMYGEKMLQAKEKLQQEVAPKVLAEVSPGLSQTQEEVGSAVQQQMEQNLAKRQKELADLVHPEPTTAAEAGTAVQQTIGKGLQQTRTGLAEEVFPGQPMTQQAAGERLLKRGTEEIEGLAKKADEAYENAYRVEEDPQNVERVTTGVDEAGKPIMENMALPIDMRPIQRALKPILADYEYTLPQTERNASPGVDILRKIVNGPRYKPLRAGERDLGLLKRAAETESGLAALRDQGQGMAAKAVAEFQAAIDAKMANAAYPGWDPASGTASPALGYLQRGRGFTRSKYETGDLLREFGGSRDLTKIEGGRMFQAATWAGDAGLNRLRRMAERFPEEMPAIGRAFIEGGGNWESLGLETKKILFKDEGIIKGLDQYYAEEAKFGPLTKLEPVVLFERLTAQSGKRINLLRDVLDKYPQHREQIGRAFIDSGGNWENLDAQTRRALFKDDRALIASLDEYYENRAQFGPLLKLEPVNLFKRMTAPGGTRINLTQEILAQTPQLRGQIARTFFEGLFDTATREGNIQNVQSTLDAVLKMDEKTLHALVPDPKIRQNMLNLFLGMKRLVANPNPSGSGLIAALTKLKGNVFTGLGALAGYGGHGGASGGLGGGAEGLLAGTAIEIGSNAALARLLFNQKFIDMLNRGVREANRGNTAGAKLAARTLEKIIGENPPEGPGETPPNPPGGGEGPPPPPPGTQGGIGEPPPTGRGGAGTGKGEPLSIYDSLQKAGDEARERFRKNMGTTMQAGFGFYGGKDVLTTIAADVAKGVKTHGAKINAAVKDMGEWGAGRIYGGYARFPEWKEQMLKDAGELSPDAAEFFGKNAKRIYASAQHTLKQRMSEMGGNAIGDVKKIFEYADAGMDAKEWYDHARPELQRIFGPHTDLFLNFLAATSPQTKVAPNVEQAMQAFQEHLAGRPFSTNFEAHVKNLGRAARGEPLSGPKVTSFIANLLGDKIRVTVDTWMAQAYGLGIKSKAHLEALAKGEDAKAALSNPQYRFLDYAITQAARERGIDPRQMQAAIWVGIKRMEGNPKYTHEPFGVVVRDYLKANPDIAAQIKKAVAEAKKAALSR